MGLENKTSEIGSTLNPQIRFFVFDTEPNMDRLVPPLPGAAAARRPARCARKRRRSTACSGTCSDARRPHAERRIADGSAHRALDAATVRPRDGLADLLWALTMKPEFQLIY